MDLKNELFLLLKGLKQAQRRGLVLSSPSTTKETGAMGREIESRQGIRR
jgi:hypothetical protein